MTNDVGQNMSIRVLDSS